MQHIVLPMLDLSYLDLHTERLAEADTVLQVSWRSVTQDVHVLAEGGQYTECVEDSDEQEVEQPLARMEHIDSFLQGQPLEAVDGQVPDSDELGFPVMLAVFYSPCKNI